jgi:galactonate dehydratase
VKIDRVETVLAGHWVYVVVTTDTGVTGVGEGGLWSFPTAAAQLAEALRPYLVGKDPRRIEHHWQYVYRSTHFRGAAIHSALAAVDVALWDILGKVLEVPVYQLLGGRVRDKVRLYIHVVGESVDRLAAAARTAVREGFTAVRFNPFDARPLDLRQGALVAAAVECVGAVRETVGPDVDLCIECHNRLLPPEAVALGAALAPFRILFLEDPIPPESPVLSGQLAYRVVVPIATGERLHNVEEFRDLVTGGPVAYIRPDLGLTGLTQGKKIAALAEAFRIGVIPHNWLSPVSTAACVQLDAAIPNFVLQEYTGEDQPPKSLLLREPLRRDGGYLVVPDRPGIGVELDVERVRRLDFQPPPIVSQLREDGSVIDT